MKTAAMIVMAAALIGCGKSEAGPGARSEGPAPKTATPAVAPLVAAYDEVREALASDDLATAQAKARSLAKGPAEGQPAMAAALGKLSAMADIEDARQAFGDLSKALLEAMKAEPKLAENAIAYRCPMAQGYQKWVQAGPPMRNPYMGKKMLECGSKADLTP